MSTLMSLNATYIRIHTCTHPCAHAYPPHTYPPYYSTTYPPIHTCTHTHTGTKCFLEMNTVLVMKSYLLVLRREHFLSRKSQHW